MTPLIKSFLEIFAFFAGAMAIVTALILGINYLNSYLICSIFVLILFIVFWIMRYLELKDYERIEGN